MAQFVENGFDIPTPFLQAHEGGNVVFFCGAGISRPHLPDFDGLVQKLFRRFGIPEGGKDAKKQARYEVAVELLDKTIAGGREGGRVRVREEINRILTPGKDICPVIHRSLLHLARTSKGQTRLVTTNFDRFFGRAIGGESIKQYLPPALPVPKREWSGVVYLHGMLPEDGKGGLDDMVISSADFGRAYILEQWAANFVRELFRNYSVCFVGYGINDPVMRYLLDALAADRLSGVSGKEMYAFADYYADGKDASEKEWKHKETAARKAWQGKGVTPILYRKKDKNNHAPLHDTLHEWASIYKQGTKGKKVIIDQHVKSSPPESAEGYVAGRMLWAMTDTLATRYFANLNPVPPLDWLNVFGDKCSGLVSRGHNGNDGKLDDAMLPMAEWLLRHLQNPALVCWFARQGGKLHSIFARMVGFRMNKIASSPMRTLWNLLMSGRMSASNAHIVDIYDWEETLRRDGPSFAVRSQLRDMLSPRISVSARQSWDGKPLPPHSKPQHVSGIVDCHINLRLESVNSTMRTIQTDSCWQALLPLMLDDFTALLRDTMDLMREVGKADDKHDGSYFALPSIAKHRQNSFNDNWTALPELVRDAWLATIETEKAKVLRVAEDWQRTPYPLFKRLAFFAAAQDGVIPKGKALDWLLADNCRWLWSSETKRESIRLMVALAPKLNAKEAGRLTRAILERPPREMYKPSATDEDFDHAVWLVLTKVRDAGMTLDKAAQNELDRLTGKYGWKIAENESDEFPYWSSGVVRVGDNLPPEYVHPPNTASGLAEWLIKPPPASDGWHNDDGTWRGYCVKNCEVTIAALEILAKQNIFPAKRWAGALSAWTQGELLQKSWQVAPLLVKAGDDTLQGFIHPLASWLREQGEKSTKKDDGLFLPLIRRIICLKHEIGNVSDDPLTNALNVPVGMAAFGFLRWLFRRDKPEIGGDILRLLNDLCDTAKAEYRPGRVMLALHVRNLFYTDKEWTRRMLLPLFDWQHEEEARATWHGFLWSQPRDLPLVAEIKHHFLYTARNMDELDDASTRKYADALTSLALYRGKKPFSREQLREATTHFPEEGLSHAANIIYRDMASAGERRGKYWRGNVVPYFKRVWPQQQEKVTERTAEQIALICTESGDNFADAVQQLQYFLKPLDRQSAIHNGLSEHGLCGRFPKDALLLLDITTSDAKMHWMPDKIRKLLDEILRADSGLVNSPEYIRLDRICQRYGV